MNESDYPTTRITPAHQAPVESQPFGVRVQPQRLPTQQDVLMLAQAKHLHAIRNRVMFIAVCVGIMTAVLLGALAFGAYVGFRVANSYNNSTDFSNCQSVGGTDPSC